MKNREKRLMNKNYGKELILDIEKEEIK